MSDQPCEYCHVATLRGGRHLASCPMMRSMSDERLLDLKQMCANAHRTEILVAPELMGEALTEIDRLKLCLKQAVEVLLIDPDLSKPAPGLDGYREGFLREAIVALGAEVEWRASSHGTGVYIATERTPKECAQRAIKLWCAYRDLPRGKQ